MKIVLLILQIVHELGLTLSLKEFNDKIRADSEQYHNSEDELLEAFKKLVDQNINPKIPDVFTSPPKHPLEVVPSPQVFISI